MIVKFVRSEEGQSLVEYSLIISLLVLAVIAALVLFGQQMIILYESNKDKILDKLGGK